MEQKTIPPDPKIPFWKTIPREFLKKAVVDALIAAVIVIFTAFFLKTATIDSFAHTRDMVDVHLSITGRVKPGDRIEIFPPSLEKQLSTNHEIWYRDVDFSLLRGRELEVRIVNGFSRETIARLPIGEKPAIDIHREIR